VQPDSHVDQGFLQSVLGVQLEQNVSWAVPRAVLDMAQHSDSEA
jgi:hypothetical protein